MEDPCSNILVRTPCKDKPHSLHRLRRLPCTTWLDAKGRASTSQPPEEEDSTLTEMTTMTITPPEKETPSEDQALEKALDPEALLDHLTVEAAEAEAAANPSRTSR